MYSEYEDTTQRSCLDTCACKPGEFAPICTSEGVTYLSPCLAGCTQVYGQSYDQVKHTFEKKLFIPEFFLWNK